MSITKHEFGMRVDAINSKWNTKVKQLQQRYSSNSQAMRHERSALRADQCIELREMIRIYMGDEERDSGIGKSMVVSNAVRADNMRRREERNKRAKKAIHLRRKGMTQQAIAEALGISASSVYGYLSTDRELRASSKSHIQRRRKQVQELRERRWTYRAIASELAISRSTVRADIRFLKDQRNALEG